MLDEEVVQAARAGEAEVVARLEERRPAGEELSRVVQRHRLEERFRREPGPAREEPAQREGRDADRGGDRLDRGLVAPFEADEFDRLPDEVVIAGRVLGEIDGAGHGVHGNLLAPMWRMGRGAATRFRTGRQAAVVRAIASARERRSAKGWRSSGGRKSPMRSVRPELASDSPETPHSSRWTTSRVQ